MPNLRIVKAKEFVWIECPDTGFFMKPSVHWPMSEKGEKKINNKKKAVDRLHRNPSNELVLKLTSGLYYLGSYAVDGPENLSREEFEELPSKVSIQFRDRCWFFCAAANR
ncbi:hypothetical protein B0H21DRAFT_725127 [Amylocystis lapponica]|nr:hypothetical protein B0H21DRAFT_725127 [Amylocystis lapponica]